MELVGGEWAPGGRARILLWAELRGLFYYYNFFLPGLSRGVVVWIVSRQTLPRSSLSCRNFIRPRG